jgi:predicted molibdopterin-dependent oxidoreductase YjgC
MARNRSKPRLYPRLTTPLVRDNGVLRPATWDEALDRAADGFRRNIEARGPNSLGTFSCSKSTNEVNFLAQKLSRLAFGTHNIDSCNRT